jgi:peptidoglycan/LPS O-acetylase OafA/YrhL
MSVRSREPDAPGAVAVAPRLDALDGLRGLCALGIVVLHVWMFVYGDAGHPAKGPLDLFIGELRLGVPLFFVLSGFLVYRPFARAALERSRPPRLGAYALRRAARILPAYWLALAASFIALRQIDHPLQVDLEQLPVFLLFAQNHFDSTAQHLDPPMWTLGVEVAFYVFLPVAAWCALRLGGGRTRQLALCGTLIGAGVLAQVLAVRQGWPDTLTDSLPLHLSEFGAGMAVAVAAHGRLLRRRSAWALVFAGAALILANGTWHALQMGDREVRQLIGDLPGVLGLALVIAGLATSTVRARALSLGPARWLGTLSYAMYLTHYVVLLVLRGTGHWPETLPAALLAVCAWTLPIALLSWVLIERPAIRWARRRTSTRAPRPAGEPRRQRTGERPALRTQLAES